MTRGPSKLATKDMTVSERIEWWKGHAHPGGARNYSHKIPEHDLRKYNLDIIRVWIKRGLL